MNARLRNQLGPITMRVEPGKVTLRDGSIVTKDRYGHPLVHPMAEAIKRAVPGEVIGVRGEHAPFSIGTGNATHMDVGFWPGHQPVESVSIVADDDAPSEPVFRGLTLGNALGGIDDLTLYGLLLTNDFHAAVTQPAWSDRQSVLVAMTENTGKLRIWSCGVDAHPLAKAAGHFSGHGTKWALLRAHGHLDGLEVIGCEFRCGAEEHWVYADNLGWRASDGVDRSRFVGNRYTTSVGPGRTCFQVCNRADEPGGSGHGLLEYEDNELLTGPGGGGSALTIAGHLGPISIRNQRIRGHHGGIALWSDVGHGLHQDAQGFTMGKVDIEDIDVDMSPDGDRSAVAIAGARRVTLVAPFNIRAPVGRTALEIDGAQQGPIDCGAFKIDTRSANVLPSQYLGFAGSPKVKRDGVTLSATQIDAMAVLNEVAAP